MFVTTPRVNAQSNLPRKISSGSGSAKLSKLFNLQLFLKRVERAFSFVWSFRGSGSSWCCRLCRTSAGRQRRRQASARLVSRVPVPAGPVRVAARRAKHFQFSSLRCRWRTLRLSPADDAALLRSWRTSLPTNKSSKPNEVNPHEQIVTRYEITGSRYDCGD